MPIKNDPLNAHSLKNDSFIRALRRQPTPHVPIWLMRQAGRYIPEYRATRGRAGSFMALAKTPELACEVTLQPLARYDLDAAILFSDILTIPDAMGLGLEFHEGEGPRFQRKIESAADVEALPDYQAIDKLGYVGDAVSLIQRELDRKVPLIGFSGAPWTLMCYMLEGGGSKDFARAKKFLFHESAASHVLLGKLARSVSRYLRMQALAGADVLMLFDSWAGLLAPYEFDEYCLRYLRYIISDLQSDNVTRDLPLIVFAKGANAHHHSIAKLGCAALGLDWTQKISVVRQQTQQMVALQGNLDPTVLYGSEAQIRFQTLMLLQDAGRDAGHIFNLGHGMNPDMNPDNVKILVDAVHEFSIAMRAGEHMGPSIAYEPLV